MGVYVSHFKIPINCVWCAVWKGCKAQDWGSRDRPENCPLVEVPTPHGRLIDVKVMENLINEQGLIKRSWNICADVALNKTMTVIEAEDE